jgi:hypothetical protein
LPPARRGRHGSADGGASPCYTVRCAAANDSILSLFYAYLIDRTEHRPPREDPREDKEAVMSLITQAMPDEDSVGAEFLLALPSVLLLGALLLFSAWAIIAGNIDTGWTSLLLGP